MKKADKTDQFAKAIVYIISLPFCVFMGWLLGWWAGIIFFLVVAVVIDNKC